MKRTTKRVLALLLAVLMVSGTAVLGFAAGLGQVTKLSVASRTSTEIKIKWKAVSGADGYLVETYNEDELEWEKEAYTKDAYYLDKALTPGTKYIYRVKAYAVQNSGRTFGSASSKLSVLTNPERVMKVQVTASSPTVVKLTWNAAAGATSYLVYQSNSKNGKFKQVVETNKTSYKASFDAAPGPLYFKVKSSAKVGSLVRNADASPAFGTSLLPNAVSEVTVRDSSAASVTLKWAVCKGATGYYVLKKDVTTNGEYVQVAKTTGTTSQINFPAAPGQVYFKVQAYSVLNKVTSKAKASPVVKLNLKPEKVTALTVQDETPSTVTLSWNGADGASGYEVYLRDDTTFDYTLLATVTDTSYTVTGLKSDTPYTFGVKAIADYNGNIQRTGWSPIVSTSTVFGDIKDFRFVLDNDNKLFLSWKEVKGADGYLVEKASAITDNTQWTQIADTKSNVFEASSVEPGGVVAKGSKYFYRVCAYTLENGEKLTTPYSKVIEVHPMSDTPKILRAATASHHGICLEWTAVDGADGYEILYYNRDEGSWKTLVEALMNSKIYLTYTNEDGVKTVYYRDWDLTVSGTYQYRVRSFVKNGDQYNYSDYSDIYKHEYVYTPEPEKYYTEPLQSTGLVGYLYDPKEQVFFTASGSWQRNFGFNKVYDIISQSVMIQYDTHPVQFTCHEGEKWMIQPWKGQYGMIFYGGEVGVYKDYQGREAPIYDCARDDDMLMMEMDAYQYLSESKEWVKSFHRPYGSYWWITGFKFGYIRMVNPLEAQAFKTFPDLRLDYHITMLDFDMRNAFVAELNRMIEEQKATGNARYKLEPYDKNSLDLYIVYQ